MFSVDYRVLCFWFALYNRWLLLKSQVEDVNAKFDALEKLKSNNWQEEEKKTEKITKKSKAKVLYLASYVNNLQCHDYSYVRQNLQTS